MMTNDKSESEKCGIIIEKTQSGYRTDIENSYLGPCHIFLTTNLNEFINTDSPEKDRIITDVLNLIDSGSSEDSNSCGTAEQRVAVLSGPHDKDIMNMSIMDMAYSSLWNACTPEYVVAGMIANIMDTLVSKSNISMIRSILDTAGSNLRFISDDEEKEGYRSWVVRHLVLGFDSCSKSQDNSFFLDHFMIGGLIITNSFVNYGKYTRMFGYDSCHESIDDLLSVDAVHAMKGLDDLNFCNTGFAIMTRPRTVSLHDALDRLPDMLDSAKSAFGWSGKNKRRHSRLLTWDVIQHDWSNDGLDSNHEQAVVNTFRKSLNELDSSLYLQAAVDVLDGGKVDADKVLAIFDDIVPKRPDSEKDLLGKLLYYKDEYGIDDLNTHIKDIAMKYEDMDLLRAWAWLVHFYMGLASRTVPKEFKVDDNEYMQYRLPAIDDDLLRKSVDAYNDGRPLPSIQDALLGHADDGKEAVDIVDGYNMLLNKQNMRPMIWYRIPYRS